MKKVSICSVFQWGDCDLKMLQGYKDHLIWRGSKLPWEQGNPLSPSQFIYQTSATPILKCNGHSHQPPIVWLNRLNKQKHGLHWKSNPLLFLASVASMCSLIITEKSLLSFQTNAWYWRLLWQKHPKNMSNMPPGRSLPRLPNRQDSPEVPLVPWKCHTLCHT